MASENQPILYFPLTIEERTLEFGPAQAGQVKTSVSIHARKQWMHEYQGGIFCIGGGF